MQRVQTRLHYQTLGQATTESGLMRLRIVRFLVVAAALLAVAVLAAGWGGLFAGTRPADLGIHDGQLAPCRPTPNCVASQIAPTDAEHYVAPIAFRTDARSA